MILPLRARHRAIFIALAVGLPILFWSALLARHPALLSRELGPEAVGLCLDAEWQDDERWGELAITTRLGRSTSDAQQAACELESREPLKQPDLLVYWSPGAPAGVLPDDAFLLGAWGDSRRCFVLPAAFVDGPGHLTLFSLGHGEIFASASLEH